MFATLALFLTRFRQRHPKPAADATILDDQRALELWLFDRDSRWK